MLVQNSGTKKQIAKNLYIKRLHKEIIGYALSKDYQIFSIKEVSNKFITFLDSCGKIKKEEFSFFWRISENLEDFKEPLTKHSILVKEELDEINKKINKIDNCLDILSKDLT